MSKLQRPHLINIEKAAFKEYALHITSQVESELSNLVSSQRKLNLFPQIKYVVLSKGKRLRPLMVVLSAESVGGNREQVMALALAFELLHAATLVHDDIIDQDNTRRGKPAVHRKWSVNDAILTGDALIALAINLASEYGRAILKAITQSALTLCDGEHMDITSSLKTVTEESYFRTIRKKSASLFSAAAYCGALAGGGTPSEVYSLSDYGENFGIVYQITDDLLDIVSKRNTVSRDIYNRTVTLPLIHSYASSNVAERKQIEATLQALADRNCDAYNRPVEYILHLLRRSGSVRYCETKIDEHVSQAIACIPWLRDSEYKTYLVEMVRALKTLKPSSSDLDRKMARAHRKTNKTPC